MAMDITVSIDVDVTLLEEAFTEAFMEEYREMIAPFFDVKDHALHIADLVARGVIDEIEAPHRGVDQFVEGYGRIGDFVSRAVVGEVDADEIIA